MTSPTRSPSSRNPNSPVSRLQQSQVALGNSAGPAPGSVAVTVVDPPTAAPADPARVRFVRNHPTVRKIVNVLWTATNLTLANVGSWTMKEGIVFSCVSLTDHGLKLVGVDVSEFEQPYKGLAKAAEYTFSITTTMGILGVTNQYTSYLGSVGATLINQGFGFDIIAGATNPGARIVQDDALIFVNLAQQWVRGSYLIERGEFGGDEVSTWFRPEDPWLAMAPDGALGAFFVGIMSQLYLDWRDRHTGGLKYPDMKAMKGLWDSIKEKVLKKAGGEVNRIPAALQHELMGDWAFAVPIILVEALQAFSYSVLKDEDCPILVTAILCGFLYGYASGNRGATRNEARRTDEMTEEALLDRARTTKPGTWARFDAITELLKHFRERTEGILRSRNFPLVALSLVYPAVETIVTQSMVSYSVMKYPNALEEMFPGYRPSASALELAQRVVPGALTGAVMISFHHFLIPAKYPILVEPEDGKPAPTGERNARISLAEAYTQTTQVAVGVGAVNALMHTGAEGLLVGLGMTYLSMLLTSSVLTKRAPVITPDKMPPTPDLVEQPQQPAVPRACGFFRGLKNLQRLREQIRHLNASRDPRVDGAPVVIHARPVPGQLNREVSTNAARPLAALTSTGVDGRDVEAAMEDLRVLIWDDDDQQPLLEEYLRDFATSGATTDTEIAVRYAALMLNIQSTWLQGRSQFVQEFWGHAQNNLRQLVIFEDSSTLDQRAIIRQALGGDDIIVAGGPPGATPRVSSAAEVTEQLLTLTQPNAARNEIRMAVKLLHGLLSNDGDAAGQLRAAIGNLVLAGGLSSAEQIRVNLSAEWPPGEAAPAMASDIYEAATSALQMLSAAVPGNSQTAEQMQILATMQAEVAMRQAAPAGVQVRLNAPAPVPSVITSEAARSVTDRALYFRTDANEIQVYRQRNSIRAYLPGDAGMIAFELSSDATSIVAIRGVPALFLSDLELMARMGLIAETSFETLQLPVVRDSSAASDAALSQIQPSIRFFGTSENNQGFISIEAGHLDIGYPAVDLAPDQIRIWRVDARNLQLMRDVLAVGDLSYRELAPLQLAERLTQSFTPLQLVNLLHSAYVPMEEGEA